MSRLPAANAAIYALTCLLAACAAPQQGAAFPALGKQIDAKQVAFGAGSCATTRTGLWEAKGGLVVEVRRPPRCKFQTLSLIVDGQAFPLAAVDSSFYLGSVTYPTPANLYEWTEQTGRLYFRVDKQFEAANVQGIVEPTCQSLNCLNEAAAVVAIRK